MHGVALQSYQNTTRSVALCTIYFGANHSDIEGLGRRFVLPVFALRQCIAVDRRLARRPKCNAAAAAAAATTMAREPFARAQPGEGLRVIAKYLQSGRANKQSSFRQRRCARTRRVAQSRQQYIGRRDSGRSRSLKAVSLHRSTRCVTERESASDAGCQQVLRPCHPVGQGIIILQQCSTAAGQRSKPSPCGGGGEGRGGLPSSILQKIAWIFSRELFEDDEHFQKGKEELFAIFKDLVFRFSPQKKLLMIASFCCEARRNFVFKFQMPLNRQFKSSFRVN